MIKEPTEKEIIIIYSDTKMSILIRQFKKKKKRQKQFLSYKQ